MVLPTEAQRVNILIHHAWDLRDEGLDDESICKQLVADGVPSDIANETPAYVDQAIEKLVHVDETREAILKELGAAIEIEDFDQIRKVLLRAVDDERTIHKAYEWLVEQLLSESHERGTVAAFGLSLLLDKGDWPLIEALSHDDENVRYRSAFALGKMGKSASHALEPLQEMLRNEKDEFARSAAEDAVASIEKDMKPWWRFW